jgi:hypothetical protein
LFPARRFWVFWIIHAGLLVGRAGCRLLFFRNTLGSFREASFPKWLSIVNKEHSVLAYLFLTIQFITMQELRQSVQGAALRLCAWIQNLLWEEVLRRDDAARFREVHNVGLSP